MSIRNMTSEENRKEQLTSSEPAFYDVNTPAYGHSSGSIRGSAPMRVKSRQYSGETSWQEFHSHFERVCNLNGWYENRLDYLWVNLTSTALAYAESLPAGSVSTYTDLCYALERRFGDSQRAEVYKSELRLRQRREGESLPALGQEIRQLIAHAYPGIGLQGMEELAIEKFREALTDSEQRMSVHRSHARTLEDAIKAALDMESWQISERRNKQHKVRAAETTEIPTTDVLTKIMEKLEQLFANKHVETINSKETVSKPRSITCFYCNKPGHIARECYKKAKDIDKAKQGNETQLH